MIELNQKSAIIALRKLASTPYEEWPIDIVGEAIDVPVSAWPGQCYGVSVAIVEAGVIVGARGRYGHYYGPVDPRCSIKSFVTCSRSLGWAQHGWIELPDGRVLDPTRWVFTATEPRLWAGPADDYDAGGNRSRGTRPMPGRSGPIIARAPDDEAFLIVLGGECDLDLSQLFWLANLPLHAFGAIENACEVYDWLDTIERRALVPLDNWNLAHEDPWDHQEGAS